MAPTPHPSADHLELYVLRRLSLKEASFLEEHVLLCALCQDALVEADAYVGAMKTVLKKDREST